jgi:hypothetical protein
MEEPKDCPSEEDIVDAVFSEAEGESNDQITTHILRCAACNEIY